MQEIADLLPSLSTKIDDLEKTTRESYCVSSSLEARLIKELGFLKADIDQKDTLLQQNVGLREAKSVLDRKLSSSEDIISGLRLEVESLRASKTKLATRIFQIEAQARDNQATSATLISMETSLGDLKTQNEHLVTQLENAKAEISCKTYEAVNSAVEEELRRQTRELNAQVNEAQEKITSLESVKEEMEKKVLQNSEIIRKDFMREADHLYQEQTVKYDNLLLQAGEKRFQLEGELQKSQETNRVSETQLQLFSEELSGKDQEIARLKEAQATALKSVQLLQHSAHKHNNDAEEINNLKKQVEFLSNECHMKDDRIRDVDVDVASTKEELEKLRQRYQALQATREQIGLEQIRRLSKQLEEVEEFRKQSDRRAKQAVDQAEEIRKKREQEFDSTLESQQRENAERFNKLDESHQAEKAALQTRLSQAEAQIETLSKKIEVHIRANSQNTLGSQVPETQFESQSLHLTNDQFALSRFESTVTAPNTSLISVEPQRVALRQITSSAGIDRKSQGMDARSSPEQDLSKDLSQVDMFFRIHEDPDYDKENELGRLEKLDENGVSSLQSRVSESQSQVDTLSLRTFASINENSQRSSSMLSDACPSTPDHMRPPRRQNSQGNEPETQLLARMNSGPVSTTHPIRSNASPSQKHSPQRSLARPNTGSKVARHQMPPPMQEEQDAHQKQYSSVFERNGLQSADSYGLTNDEFTQSMSQKKHVSTANSSKTPLDGIGSPRSWQRVYLALTGTATNKRPSVQRASKDGQTPRTPTTRALPANSPLSRNLSALPTLGNLSHTNALREDPYGSLKRRAIPVSDDKPGEYTKRLKSSNISKSEFVPSAQAPFAGHGEVASLTPTVASYQDAQIRQSENRSQDIGVEQSESQSQYVDARESGSQSQKKHQVTGADNHNQGTDTMSTSSSQSQHSQKKTTGSQLQSQKHRDLPAAARSGMRSSNRDSKSSGTRTGRRQKKGKSRYDLRFSRELRGK